MDKKPATFTAALWLILANALLWLGFAVLVVSGAHPAMPDDPLVRGIVAGLALLASGALAGLYVLLAKRSGPAYFAALVLLLFIALLTVADEVGIWDFAVLLLTLAPVILLLFPRAWYFRRGPGAAKTA
ncbi:MAG: hypothetical protein L0Z70_01025 [Chloroflexi bacterium]|nr:hypothetical protein [Chloroflexota bacterium]